MGWERGALFRVLMGQKSWLSFNQELAQNKQTKQNEKKKKTKKKKNSLPSVMPSQ